MDVASRNDGVAVWPCLECVRILFLYVGRTMWRAGNCTSHIFFYENANPKIAQVTLLLSH